MMHCSRLALTAAAFLLAAPAAAQIFDTAPVDEAALATITGRADTAMSITASNVAQVSGNSVSGTSTTGDISFDGSAFGNLNGLSLLSANTGNNVAINSSLNVNVSIQP